jgi:hypothetical protein
MPRPAAFRQELFQTIQNISGWCQGLIISRVARLRSQGFLSRRLAEMDHDEIRDNQGHKACGHQRHPADPKWQFAAKSPKRWKRC